MGAHFASTPSQPRSRERRHQIAALGVALGVGLLGFTFVDGDGRTGHGVPRSIPTSSAPTVLGVTIDRDDAAPAASPATFEDAGGASSTTRPPRTTTTTTPSTTGRPSTTTTGPAELIPPVVVENTSTTVDSSTSTTAAETTTTAVADPAP